MKKNIFFILMLGCVTSWGCGSLNKNLLINDSPKSENMWDGTGFKRSEVQGTGIDPQARDIEKRLGYYSQ